VGKLRSHSWALEVTKAHAILVKEEFTGKKEDREEKFRSPNA
jgi:hypothetical protein